MAIRKQGGIFEKITRLQRELMQNKPPFSEMVKEIQAMRFKISPKGDMGQFNFSSPLLVELLWYIGKVDEFFAREMHNLTKQEQQAVEAFVHMLWHKVHESLDTPDLVYALNLSEDSDLEVYKEQPSLLN